MSPADLPHDDTAAPSQEELLSALFANLIIQQTNMALMFLGKVPHPETGEAVRDIDSAKMLIDQLEMLEVKTKGNLNKREDTLLKQSLTALRMAFVEAVEYQTPDTASAKESKAAAPKTESQTGSPSQPAPSAEDEERRKKFSKRY